jgi:hypothetical protein
VLALLLAVGACGDDDGDQVDAEDKRSRVGAAASFAGGTVWVAGGTEGPALDGPVDPFTGMPNEEWGPLEAVIAYDLDGAEVDRVAVDLDGGEVLFEPAVVLAGDRPLLVGGRCEWNGFGCNGDPESFVAWVDGEEAERVDLGGAVAGTAVPVGSFDGVGWAIVDTRGTPRLLRVEGDEVTLSELPPAIWTGHACVGPDGVVAAVAADTDGRPGPEGVELLVRSAAVDDVAWRSTGVHLVDEEFRGAWPYCSGGGEVVVNLRDERPVVLRIDGAVPVDGAEAPEDLRGEGRLAVASDPGSELIVVSHTCFFEGEGGSCPVHAYRPGQGWTELGTVAWPAMANAAPTLALVDGEVLSIGGLAVVGGVAPSVVG